MNQTKQLGLDRDAVKVCPRRLSFLFTLCVLCMAIPAPAADRVIEIPLPPSPDRVLNKVGGFFHRLFNGDKNRRSHNEDRDDDDQSTRSLQSSPSGRTGRSTDPVGNVSQVEDRTTRGAKPKSNSQSTVASTKTSHQDSEHRDSSSEPLKPSVSPKPSASHGEDHASTAQTTKPASPSPSGSATASTQPTPPAVEAPVEFARPVPGKRGFVYPPGVAESSDNIVDVVGFQPGQIVRDPRTKALFRVP